MNKLFNYKTKGFTLIELMVVIGIIGVLASVFMVSLSRAAVKARDARRLADLQSFQLALNSYFNANDHYPYTTCASPGAWTSFDSPNYSVNSVCDTVGGAGVTLSEKLAPYTQPLKDPKNLGTDSGYLYINQYGAYDYCILIWRTPENLNNFPSTMVPPNRCSAWNSSGQCTAGTNSIFFGKGTYATTTNC